MPFDRDASTADALLTDLYLDAILSGRPLRDDVTQSDAAGPPRGRLDPAIRAASERLRRDLIRVHPSFRFEERLATRLAEAAAELRIPAAVGAEGHVVPFRGPSYGPLQPVAGASDATPDDDQLIDLAGEHRDLSRPLLIGGALTSAALSLAGAALVAWRRTRPGSPMVRAARAVREARGVAATGIPFGSRRLD
jgi:hypothetical protein